jgi:hypothetical protein
MVIQIHLKKCSIAFKIKKLMSLPAKPEINLQIVKLQNIVDKKIKLTCFFLKPYVEPFKKFPGGRTF